MSLTEGSTTLTVTVPGTGFATAAQGALAASATQPGDLGTAAASDTSDFATAAQGALADSAVQPGDPVSVNAQTGTTYTLVLTDAGKVVTLANASAVTLTVPPNCSASRSRSGPSSPWSRTTLAPSPSLREAA